MTVECLPREHEPYRRARSSVQMKPRNHSRVLIFRPVGGGALVRFVRSRKERTPAVRTRHLSLNYRRRG
jgi:hypothetical protein